MFYGSEDMLIKLAKFFNVSTDYFLGVDSDNVIDVSGLTSSEIGHIILLVDNLKTAIKNDNYKSSYFRYWCLERFMLGIYVKLYDLRTKQEFICEADYN